MVRQVCGSALLPELEVLRMKLSLGLHVEERMGEEAIEQQQAEVGKLVADVMEARRALGLPGLRDVGTLDGWASSEDLVRIYRACFATLQKFDYFGSAEIGGLAAAFQAHAAAGGGPTALEWLSLPEGRAECHGVGPHQ